MGYLRGEGLGGGMLESSRVELDEKRRPKRLAFSEGVLATEPSERIRGGKADLQKLLEISLTKGQKFLSVGEPWRSAHFLFMKVRLIRRRTSLQRFRAEFAISTVSLTKGKRTAVIEPWILRRKRFS